MKITPKQNIQQSRVKIVDKIRTMFSNGKVKLRTLLRDVFEKETSKKLSKEEIEKYDEYLKEVLPKDVFDPNVKREYTPPWTTTDADLKGISWGRIEFFTEDKKKLDAIETFEERCEFRKSLIRAKRYKIIPDSKN